MISLQTLHKILRQPPWTLAECDALNTYQDHEGINGFSCPNNQNHPGIRVALRAVPIGWLCNYCGKTLGQLTEQDLTDT